MKAILIVIPALLWVNTGCSTELPAHDGPPTFQEVETGRAFDPQHSGRVSGRVTWNGPIPKPPGFLHGVPRTSGPGFEFRTAENPNRPHIDPGTRAVQYAVVFLRGARPEASRRWDLPPVSVEIGQGKITVLQGKHRGRIGFVKRGDHITVSTNEAVYHVLRGRGAAFFSLPLPNPKHTVTRTLSRPGRVELTSGTGLYWASADLFVSDHPYYTLTDQDGRFSLDHAPAGNAEVVVWMPGWQALKTERDPDSTQVARQKYSPPIERIETVFINPSQVAEVNITVP